VTYDDARDRVASFSGAELAADGPPIDVTVPSSAWAAFGQYVRDAVGCRFFSFMTAVDRQADGLEVIAWVDNVDAGLSILMRTRLEPGCTTCPSLAPVYRGADWMERECYDMFGIRFDGHPDLRRILLPDDWDGHPLLKSYEVDTPHPPYR